ncbi:hypothetical protein CARUB_v10021499mg [Capsella rubella]|uniref:Uncharacterized protein n=1 Tax=Capsella rubella TaxID=81985 RepID=R0IBM2_9BRAS|nr:hypothetical protein CARUB_v10021499mg [Capsella rubella]
MDFHGMKRKQLQSLCKKHGIPANLKNVEMANRLASAFENDIVVQKVRFSSENEAFLLYSLFEGMPAEEPILENSAEHWKETNPSKDDEKSSSEKDVQATNLHGNFFETNSAEEEMEIAKVGCQGAGHCEEQSPEMFLDEYAQWDPEEAGDTHVKAISSSKTVNQEFVEDMPQGMAKEDSPSTSESDLSSKNALDSARAVLGDISNTQDLDSQLLKREHEQKTCLMDVTMGKGEASSLSEFLVERSVAKIRPDNGTIDCYLSVEKTTPPALVQLGVPPSSNINDKDMVSTVLTAENIETKAIMENSSECRSSKDGLTLTCSLKKTTQAENLHDSFSGYNTEISKVGCTSFGDCVNLDILDEVKGEVLRKSEQRSSYERCYKLNALELRRCSATDYTSHSLEEKKVSKRFEESDTSSNPERHMLIGDSKLDGRKNIGDYSASTCEEFFFTSLERKQFLVNFERYSAGKQEQKEVNGSVIEESLVAAPDLREKTIASSSGCITSKISYSHDFNAGKETADSELMLNDCQAEGVVGLDTTLGTSKKSREHCPHVDLINIFDFDTEEAETIMGAERNVSIRSYVTLPAKGNSEEVPSYLEAAGHCSMVSEEPGLSTDIQNQAHVSLEGLAITTDNDETDEQTKKIQKGFEGNFRCCLLYWDTLESGLITASTISILTEKTISLIPNESTVQNNMKEKDKEMIRREARPETRKEYLNIDESGALSKMQVRRESSLTYRTQVKPKIHDMKENAPNSRIVRNLNVTAPRTSKRHPLQDLTKN